MEIIKKLTYTVLLIMANCTKGDHFMRILTLSIAPYTEMRPVPPFNKGHNEYMVVKESSVPYTQYFYVGEIKGFKHEKGFEYVVSVKATRLKNPPMDSSNTEYEFIKILSKEKKQDNSSVFQLSEP